MKLIAKVAGVNTMRTNYFITTALLFVVGCSSRATLEALPYGHPANPEAPEGMTTPVGETLPATSFIFLGETRRG